MKLTDAKAAVRRAFPNLDAAAVTEVLKAVIRRDELRVTDFAGDTYSVLDDWTPERLNAAISSTVALFNYNMRPSRKLKAVRK